MPPNRNEPATKFFGPNYPFVKSVPPSQLVVRLYNLTPGQHWRPAFAALIQSQQVLLPVPGMLTWQRFIAPFRWRWQYAINRVTFTVMDLITPSPVFIITINFIQTRWMLNQVKQFAGSYAFDGTATLAWKDVPRS